MVSKTIKRTPPKSIKDLRRTATSTAAATTTTPTTRRHRRSNKSPAKKAAAKVLASINKSIVTCHKRLIKLFSKLARIATPNRSAAKSGYKILKKSDPKSLSPRRTLTFDEDDHRSPLLPPPPPPSAASPTAAVRTVFLDLDETLVHSRSGPPPERFDFVVRPRIDGEATTFYVLKRPGVDEFLASLAERGYEVVVFTAGLREYASLVVDRLDRGRGFVAHRLYRDACVEREGRLVKDLSAAGRDLRRAVIVDDNPNSYSLQPENAVPVRPFVDDLCDRELEKLLGLFEGLDGFDDLREGVKDYLDKNVALVDDDIHNVNNNTLGLGL